MIPYLTEQLEKQNMLMAMWSIKRGFSTTLIFVNFVIPTMRTGNAASRRGFFLMISKEHFTLAIYGLSDHGLKMPNCNYVTTPWGSIRKWVRTTTIGLIGLTHTYQWLGNYSSQICLHTHQLLPYPCFLVPSSTELFCGVAWSWTFSISIFGWLIRS